MSNNLFRTKSIEHISSPEQLNDYIRVSTPSVWMRLIDTRATEVLNHNSECKTCEHALQCLAGCRASALEFHPTEILAPDPAVCTIPKGDWVDKISAVMQKINPEIRIRI